MSEKQKLKKLIEEDKNTLESLKNILPMIESNSVAYDYLNKIILDFEKGLNDLTEELKNA